ncbi:MAG: family 43 glycosylhydrolase [Clostridia bacterium]|nr:family 43 glycosylhydrolase [Clostridia bacterium]
MKKSILPLLCLILFFALSLCGAAAQVRFVCDGGSDQNDGLTAASPKKTPAACAADLTDGGVLCVCGPLTLSGDALVLPASGGTLTFSSVYGGVDYAAQNAAVLNLCGFTYLSGDAAFEDITIHDASSLYFNYLVCRGHDLTVGERVRCTKESGEYITILGGEYIHSSAMTAKEVSFYDYTIRVASGTWFMINGSNKRTSNESAMGATGGVHLVIDGGSFTGKPENHADAMISAGGYASQDGDYSIEISGGVFNTPIVAIARPGNNSGRYTAYYEGDVDLRITGGEFYGGAVTTVQSEAASYIGGDYRLQISGGQFPNLVSIAPLRVRGVSSCDLPKTLQAFADGFDVTGKLVYHKTELQSLPAPAGVVFVGSGFDGDGKNANSPLSSLEEAVAALTQSGGTVVVCAPLRIESAALPHTNGTLTVTSVYGGVDFRTKSGAKIELAGNLSLGGATRFCAVDFQARSLSATIFCAGNPLTVDKDVRCTMHTDGGVTEYIGIYTGDRLVASSGAAPGRAPASVTVNGGAWRFLRAGNERAHGGANTLRTVEGDSFIRIGGGEFYGDICGTGKNNQTGNITLEISGGRFFCSIFGMATPANIDNDTSAVNGDITLRIFGGEFHGDIAPVQDPNKNILNGRFTLRIFGGDFRAVGSIRGAADVRGDNSSLLVSAPHFDRATEGEMTFQNPIVGYGADPSVLYHEGWYYYARATTVGGAQAIQISRSPNVCDIGHTRAKTVFVADDTQKSIWAPQVCYFDGGFYIYFSGCASTSTAAPRTPYILRSDGADPLGSYTPLGAPENLDPNIYSWLSPRILEYGGQRYYLSSVFEAASDNTSSRHVQKLIIAKLASPTAFAEGATVIAAPTKAWEGYAILEGPYPLCGSDGTLYIAYAANHADGDDYCTGLLKLVGDDLCDPASWKKQAEPMQARDGENLIFAPGAAIFVPAPTGGGTLAVYHAKLHAQNRYNRCIFVQPLGEKDGAPYLGAPPATETALTVPLNPMPIAARIFGFDEVKTAGAGDLDGDGRITLHDALLVLYAALHDLGGDAFDLNADGALNVADVIHLLRTIAG